MSEHDNSGVGAPAFTPTKVNQHYTDTSNGDLYLSNGVASSANWILQGSGGGGVVDGIVAPRVVDITENRADVGATVNRQDTATSGNSYNLSAGVFGGVTYGYGTINLFHAGGINDVGAPNTGGALMTLANVSSALGQTGEANNGAKHGLLIAGVEADGGNASVVNAGTGCHVLGTVETAGTGTADIDTLGKFNLLSGGAVAAAAGVATMKINNTANVGNLLGGYANAADGTADVSLGDATGGKGSVVFGVASCNTAAQTATVQGSGDGSLVVGSAQQQAGQAVNASVIATGDGNVALGQADATTAAADIASTGSGSFAFGIAQGVNPNAGNISATGFGSFAGGAALEGTIATSGNGGIAMGKTAYGSSIQSQSNGAFAMGHAYNGSILASDDGAVASGNAYDNNITASAYGAFAHGSANGGAIVASAENAFQFGIGTNATANTVQIGAAGLRLHMTAGVPGVLQDGDIFVDAGVVKIRSNGITVSI